MAYGSAELPRIVATAFLVPAFGALRTPTPIRCGLAGVLLGLGASLRFGEIVFAVPAVLSVLLGSRDDATGAAWRFRVTRAAAVLAGVAATVLVVIGVSDALYWGRPFHSLFAIVDYTLVQRLSSRGYEPPWYLPDAPERVERRAAGGAGLPGVGSGRVDWRCSGRPCRWPCSACCRTKKRATRLPPFRSGRWRRRRGCVRGSSADTCARRSPFALALARWASCSSSRRPSPSTPASSASSARRLRCASAGSWGKACAAARIAAEQLWRFGGRLYLDASPPLVELDLQGPDAERLLRDAACRPDVQWAAIRLRPLPAAMTADLSDCGLAPELTDTEAGYLLFRKP